MEQDTRRSEADGSRGTGAGATGGGGSGVGGTAGLLRSMQGSGPAAGRAGPEPSTGASEPALFAEDKAASFRQQWESVQAGFVDDPRSAVEQADQLVAETVRRLAEVFAQERATLEQQWGRGGDVSTEDLRLTLQRYRSFFRRLLTV